MDLEHFMNDGGPAFPQSVERVDGGITTVFTGMSLRDYFAAAAIQGLLATNPTANDNIEPTPDNLAIAAYKLSDAMLKERERKT